MNGKYDIIYNAAEANFLGYMPCIMILIDDILGSTEFYFIRVLIFDYLRNLYVSKKSWRFRATLLY
jgi:hypothetical protein